MTTHFIQALHSIKTLVFGTILLVCCFCGRPATASFVLTLGLGTPVVTMNQVSIPIEALFTSDAGIPSENYIDTFIVDVSLSSSALNTPLFPSLDNYSRYSFSNALPNWEGYTPDSTTGRSLLLTTNLGTSLTHLVSTVKIADLVIDIEGIEQGTYSASIFQSGVTSAIGEINDTAFDSLDYLGVDPINLNAPGTASFTITAVPEPASAIGFTILMAFIGVIWWRRQPIVADRSVDRRPSCR